MSDCYHEFGMLARTAAHDALFVSTLTAQAVARSVHLGGFTTARAADVLLLDDNAEAVRYLSVVRTAGLIGVDQEDQLLAALRDQGGDRLLVVFVIHAPACAGSH